jgi:hypothetical protein
MRETFLQALKRMGTGPCQNCCHFDTCRAERLACRDFQRYTNCKKTLRADVDRYPDALVYDRVFRDIDQDELTQE